MYPSAMSLSRGDYIKTQTMTFTLGVYPGDIVPLASEVIVSFHPAKWKSICRSSCTLHLIIGSYANPSPPFEHKSAFEYFCFSLIIPISFRSMYHCLWNRSADWPGCVKWHWQGVISPRARDENKWDDIHPCLPLPILSTVLIGCWNCWN